MIPGIYHVGAGFTMPPPEVSLTHKTFAGHENIFCFEVRLLKPLKDAPDQVRYETHYYPASPENIQGISF